MTRLGELLAGCVGIGLRTERQKPSPPGQVAVLHTRTTLRSTHGGRESGGPGRTFGAPRSLDSPLQA